MTMSDVTHTYFLACFQVLLKLNEVDSLTGWYPPLPQISRLTTPGRRRPQGFLPQPDEFLFYNNWKEYCGKFILPKFMND